ncbi:hypothetical protein D3C72_1714320 [compost metagenome]
MKNMILILAASLGVSAHASTRVNNGYVDSNLIYSCVEENPVDPENPYLAVLRRTHEGPLLVVVKKNSEEVEYEGLMSDRPNIRCIVQCDLRENKKDNVGFGVTTLGKYKQGIFSSPSLSMAMKCQEYGE